MRECGSPAKEFLRIQSTFALVLVTSSYVIQSLPWYKYGTNDSALNSRTQSFELTKLHAFATKQTNRMYTG